MALTDDILHSWRSPDRVMRNLLADGRREGRALAFLIGACLLIFLAQWPRLARLAQQEPEIPFQAFIAGAMMGWLFIAPILLYGVAALLQLACRLLRRPISGWAARLAFFWALLAASPLWLLNGLIAGLLGPGLVTSVLGFAILVAFFWLLLRMLAAAALEAGAAKA